MNYRTILILIGFMISGCAAPQSIPSTMSSPVPSGTSTPTPSSTSTTSPTVAFTPTLVSPPAGAEVIFDESSTRNLTGTLYGEGETAILLANMSIGGQKQWYPFVAAVDKQKFTTITFDYRNINDVGPDMDNLLSWLRQEGFERVICIGASLGTRACSSIALEPEIEGIVLIAGSVHHASVAEATYPKLFISGALDRWAFDIQTGYEQAAEPKELVLFEENRSHGTDLFASKDKEPFLSLLIDFVNSLANP
jgi:hypothetical protein